MAFHCLAAIKISHFRIDKANKLIESLNVIFIETQWGNCPIE